MQINKTEIAGLIVFKPKKFDDERGYFFESFNLKSYQEAIGENIQFVQDNESISKKGVLRGLHFQHPPMAQGKLVRVVSGAVLDIAVDLRKNSTTYGKWNSVILSEENGMQFWIPEGFAHGFVALEDNTKFLYKCTNYYSPENESTIKWDDPVLAIDWGNESFLVSSKDKEGQNFTSFVTPF